MNSRLKAFLRVISAICLWGAPILAVVALFGSLAGGFDLYRTTAMAGAGAYAVVVGLLIGGVLRLLLSIDDRLERLEGKL
jgi:tetrahydromethanopterin S-methyltransferase subunit B